MNGRNTYAIFSRHRRDLRRRRPVQIVELHFAGNIHKEVHPVPTIVPEPRQNRVSRAYPSRLARSGK